VNWKTVSIGLASACVVACKSSDGGTHSSAGAGAAGPVKIVQPWTDQFLVPALLVADSVRIEGPVGLLDHLATRTEPDAHARREETTAQGFLQEITQKPDVAPAEIHAFLDQLEIVALKRITVLERPGPVNVLILATGDVFLRNLTTKAEQRETSLRIEGRIERAAVR
jgi:hypothetical protein